MWNSAEGPETYSNCLDLNIVGAAVDPGAPGGSPGSPGGGVPGGAGGANAGNAAGDDGGGGSMGVAVGVVAVILLGGGFWYRYFREPSPGKPPVEVKLAVPAGRWESEPAQPPPPPRPPAGPEDLPDGWSEVLDPASGRNYFYNAATGESTWLRPSFV